MVMVYCPRCGKAFKVNGDKDLVKCIRCGALLKIVRRNGDFEIHEIQI